MWPEVEQVLSKHRYELILSGAPLRQYLTSNNELDPTIWTLTQLNFLEISQCSLVVSLPDGIGKLANLSTLSLTSNLLERIPDEMKNLHNLRHLDLSFNQLSKLPDDLFLQLSHLETLNLSNNRLEEVAPFSVENKRLAIVNLSHNQLQSLHDFPNNLENLSQLD